MNTIAFLFLLVAESFAVGLMWHNKSAQSGKEHESESPDPAVLFSSRSANFGKPAPQVQAQETEELLPGEQQIKSSAI